MIDSIVRNYFCYGKLNNEPESFLDSLKNCTNEEICNLIIELPQKDIFPANIPQYSSWIDGTINMIKYLRMSGNFGPSFLEVGQKYLEYGHNERAYVKYGENHAKLSELYGVTSIEKRDRKRVYLNQLGYAIEKKSSEEQLTIFHKLSGNIPIVQYAIKNNIDNVSELEKYLCRYLSESTAGRRRKNTWDIVVSLVEEQKYEL